MIGLSLARPVERIRVRARRWQSGTGPPRVLAGLSGAAAGNDPGRDGRRPRVPVVDAARPGEVRDRAEGGS
jgi:hypothetical protein